MLCILTTFGCVQHPKAGQNTQQILSQFFFNLMEKMFSINQFLLLWCFCKISRLILEKFDIFLGGVETGSMYVQSVQCVWYIRYVHAPYSYIYTNPFMHVPTYLLALPVHGPRFTSPLFLHNIFRSLRWLSSGRMNEWMFFSNLKDFLWGV